MILTKAELACLLEVETTAEQAKQILRRNQAILRSVRGRESITITIGCPHCRGSCVGCAYEVGRQAGVYSSWCLDYSFGGICARDVNCVDLADCCVNVEAEHADVQDRKRAKRWAQGHIEWAQEVIRRASKVGRDSKKRRKA